MGEARPRTKDGDHDTARDPHWCCCCRLFLAGGIWTSWGSGSGESISRSRALEPKLDAEPSIATFCFSIASRATCALTMKFSVRSNFRWRRSASSLTLSRIVVPTARFCWPTFSPDNDTLLLLCQPSTLAMIVQCTITYAVSCANKDLSAELWPSILCRHSLVSGLTLIAHLVFESTERWKPLRPLSPNAPSNLETFF